MRQTNERTRAGALFALATRAQREGVDALHDAELFRLLAEHRWAVGRLASPHLGLELRSLLNAASLRAHAVLHRRSRTPGTPLGVSIQRVARGTLVSFIVFAASAGLTLAAVLADPWLSLALVPRELLAQIDGNAWGSRGGALADLGMTLFYWGNNLRASFLALSLGVLAGVPALLVLAFNGMLLGAVAGSAIHHGVLHRLLAWVAPHGVPEMGALVLCGGIGWELGLAWIRPGLVRRRDALATAGRELLPVTLVAGALVICAAPLEGFVAPLDLPPALDLGITLAWLLLLAVGARYAIIRAKPDPGAV
jgi:uncharacterized membrane protein SpoIIM required for sporulation